MQITFTTIGLTLDLIGAIILFFNGPPIFPILPNGSELVWDGDNSQPEKAKLAKRKNRLSRSALFIIIIGFIFQIIGSMFHI